MCVLYVRMCGARLYVCEGSTVCVLYVWREAAVMKTLHSVCVLYVWREAVCVQVMCSGTATLHYMYVAYTECVCVRMLQESAGQGGSCVYRWTCIVCVQGWWDIAPKTESVCGDTRVGVEGADSKVCWTEVEG